MPCVYACTQHYMDMYYMSHDGLILAMPHSSLRAYCMSTRTAVWAAFKKRMKGALYHNVHAPSTLRVRMIFVDTVCTGG